MLKVQPNYENKRVLVVAAHPDDETLGCGGTIARLSSEGCNVEVAILGEGVTSRITNHDRRTDYTEVEALRGRCLGACAILGVRDVHFFGLPDNRFDTVPLLDVIKLIEELIQSFRPQVIYTHHSGDLNIDHLVVHRAVLTATRPQGGQWVKTIYAFQVPSSTEWAFNEFSPLHPNVFVDISATLETKIKAMKLYESERRPFPHPRSPEALRAIALQWGSAAGLGAAEAFRLIRSIEQ